MSAQGRNVLSCSPLPSQAPASNDAGAMVMSLVEEPTVSVCWRGLPMPFEHLIETVRIRGLPEQETPALNAALTAFSLP
jgi:hypothetical protein